MGCEFSERMKSSRSFIPWAAGNPTTSYLSKVASIAAVADSGDAVFVCCVRARAPGRINSIASHVSEGAQSFVQVVGDLISFSPAIRE